MQLYIFSVPHSYGKFDNASALTTIDDSTYEQDSPHIRYLCANDMACINERRTSTSYRMAHVGCRQQQE